MARTRLPAPEGLVEVVDFMPWAGAGHLPTRRIVRLVTVVAGVVDVVVDVAGTTPDSVTSAGLGLGGARVSTPGFSPAGPGVSARLRAGQRAVVTVDAPGQPGAALTVAGAEDLRARTEAAWQAHLRQLAYDGFHAATVRRSLLTLAALTQESAGAVVAEPTAWWARLVDVAGAAVVASSVGLYEEAARHGEWLAGVLDRRPPLPAAHALDGQPVETDGGVPSAPLPAYPLLLDAVDPDQPGGAAVAAALWPGLVRVADWLAAGWAESSTVPEDLAAWHVLEGVAAREARADPLSLDALSWRMAAAELRGWLDAGAAEAPPDPLLLLAPRLGPWSAAGAGAVDETAHQLVQRVLDHWDADEGVHRPAAPTPHLMAVAALADLGRWDEAHERMDAVLGDPALAADLGAGTHLALVRACLALSTGPR